MCIGGIYVAAPFGPFEVMRGLPLRVAGVIFNLCFNNAFTLEEARNQNAIVSVQTLLPNGT